MFYQCITIKPLLTNSNIILSEDIFPRLHSLFVKNGSIFGISFPEYTYIKHGRIGNKVNILCEDKESLRKLNLADIFNTNEEISVDNTIYETQQFQLFCRIRENAHTNRYINRLKKRHIFFSNEDEPIINGHIKSHNRKIFSHAYIKLKSGSTKQSFNLFIKPVITDHPSFNSYGLVINP